MKAFFVFVGRFLFGIIFYAMFWTFLKKLKRMIGFKKNEIISSSINNVLYKNLKAEYFFIDHAINEYEDELSKIVIEELIVENDCCFVLERLKLTIKQFANFIESISDIIRNSYTDDYLSKECIFISFVSHNRDQRKQNDEAHWFKIKCYKSNMYNRLVSQQVWWHIKDYENMNQPQLINKMCPYICEGELLCNLVYDLNEENVICKRNYKSMQLDPYMIIYFDDLFVDGIREIDILYISNYIKCLLIKDFVVMDVKITDIGIEMGKITLFVYVKISPPTSMFGDSQYIHLVKESFLNIDRRHFLCKEFHSLARVFYKL